MLRLGITGGIGSGKSTVCRIFSRLGIPVYNADERAKWLVDHHPGMRQSIIEVFGEKAFEAGIYNRPYIASIVFNNQESLEKLNGIIHPVVLNDWEEFCKSHQEHVYIVKEAAIMIEAGGRGLLDRIVLVYSPKESRIRRLMERDGLERAAIEARMNKQMPDEEKIKLADDIIYNDEQHSLIEQVYALHRDILHREP